MGLTPLMRASERAIATVEKWSPAKRAFARKVMFQGSFADIENRRAKMEKSEFIIQFKAALLKELGDDYDEGYADQIAPTYWDDFGHDGTLTPQDCAEGEASEWGQE